MFSYPDPPAPPTFDLLSRSFAYRPEARFTGLLQPYFWQRHAQHHHVSFGHGEHDTFSESLTLWAWLSQILSASKSCLAASARVLVLCCCLGRPLPSANTGALCKARAKLPLPFLRELTTDLGSQLETRAPDSWKWHQRNVRLVDGSIVLVPDTDANLKAFPQQRAQKPGTSYTCMRLVVLLAFATAALLDCACGPYRGKGSGEMSLLSSLLARLQAGDILLGDRYYGSYGLLAWLLAQGVDGCLRLPKGHQTEFRQGQRLTENDYLHTWSKPKDRPKWLSEETWQSLPETLSVRLVYFQVRQRGFRTRSLYLVTTLMDHHRYSLDQLQQLYRERWHAELDIRALKQGLGLKLLRCKSPEMVRAELWVHLLGYNLVRCVLAQAALERGLKARQLSFQGAVQTLEAFRWLLCSQDEAGGAVSAPVAQALTAALSVHRVGNRPDRWEPRELKHRQRKYPELKKSRQQRRAELAEEGTAGQALGRKGGGKNRPSGR